MPSVAGSMPCQTMRRSASCPASPGDSRQAITPTRASVGMASGQPRVSTTRQAPDHCSCSGILCSVGMAHSQGRITSVASSGVHSGEAMRGTSWGVA